MCESQPHPRPRSGRLAPSLQFWGVKLGIRPYLKVKDSFINKSPSPPNIIPTIISPPLGDGCFRVYWGQPSQRASPLSVKNRSVNLTHS